MDARDINIRIVAVYKVIFLVLGTIGNVLFIHLIVKKRHLQSRTSVLQCFQCFFHLFCQVGTVMNGVFEFKNSLNRSDCFDRIVTYVFFQAAQGIIMIVIVLDILVFVKFPTVYMNSSLKKYILVTASPVLAFSIFTTYIAFISRNEDPIPSCAPPFVFNSEDSLLQKYFQILFSIIVLVLYIILINIFRKKQQTNNRNSMKTVKRLQLSVFIFCFTWFFSQLFALFILKVATVVSWGGVAFSHVYLFICLSYSNTFYVTMWKSKEYRDQFYSLWWPGKQRSTNITVVQGSVSLVKVPSTNFIRNQR